ncbi:MAG: GTP-sensing pleiotropic transcriptional regulator CodY [Bacillota bacterium]|nr:GTP-sensing pleiotropic transcriptional regulator CodY [Bacillota bacterium]
MRDLLEQTRQITRLVQQLSRRPEEFREMAQVLSRLIGANVYIVDTRGVVLGYALTHGFECDILREEVIGPMRFPASYMAGLGRITETHPNLRQEGRNCVFKSNEACLLAEKVTTLVPIKGGGERLGTLILARFAQHFEDRELILAEYAATVVGMEILRVKSEQMEGEARKKATVQLALGTLSYSELEAIRHILTELEGDEGLLVASRIADRVGITRSVIVNALRKFESAGVIESRSLGMKGTRIRILNPYLMQELAKLD